MSNLKDGWNNQDNQIPEGIIGIEINPYPSVPEEYLFVPWIPGWVPPIDLGFVTTGWREPTLPDIHKLYWIGIHGQWCPCASSCFERFQVSDGWNRIFHKAVTMMGGILIWHISVQWKWLRICADGSYYPGRVFWQIRQDLEFVRFCYSSIQSSCLGFFSPLGYWAIIWFSERIGLIHDVKIFSELCRHNRKN